MSSPSDCLCACEDPVVATVPGTEGDAGAAGTNGTNIYTTIASTGAAIAKGASGTIVVADATIFPTPSGTPYQRIFIQNRGYYSITNKSGVTLTVTYLNVSYNSASATPTLGDTVVPAGLEYDTSIPVPIAQGGTNAITATLARAELGVGGENLSVYAAGTVYALTATSALLDFGTTDPSLTITSAGTWLLLAKVRIDYNAKTTAAVRTITVKLRRTNNTAADITSATTAVKTEIVTTLTYTLFNGPIPSVIYTTTNSDDIIQVWGAADDISGAGTFDAAEASIVAVKLFDGTV